MARACCGRNCEKYGAVNDAAENAALRDAVYDEHCKNGSCSDSRSESAMAGYCAYMSDIGKCCINMTFSDCSACAPFCRLCETVPSLKKIEPKIVPRKNCSVRNHPRHLRMTALAAISVIGLSLALPPSSEGAIFIFLAGLSVISYLTATSLFRFISRRVAGLAAFGYNPARAYLAGHKTGKSRTHDDDPDLPGTTGAGHKNGASATKR